MKQITDPVWEVGGKLIKDFHEAQRAQLAEILRPESVDGEEKEFFKPESLATVIQNRADQILKILSLKAPAVKKPRSDKGTKRTAKQNSAAPNTQPKVN